jgi:hypothetical protein
MQAKKERGAKDRSGDRRILKYDQSPALMRGMGTNIHIHASLAGITTQPPSLDQVSHGDQRLELGS